MSSAGDRLVGTFMQPTQNRCPGPGVAARVSVSCTGYFDGELPEAYRVFKWAPGGSCGKVE
jgi:hypothetical protein